MTQSVENGAAPSVNQILAARLVVQCNAILGRATPSALWRLAHTPIPPAKGDEPA